MTDPQTPPELFEMTPARWQALGKSGAGHKYRYGHAAIVSGPAGQGGAARLAARGALRIGAGVVSLVCPSGAVPEHAARLDAIMVKSFAARDDFTSCLSRIDPAAICIGPNLGTDSAAAACLLAVSALSRPTCFDADAITLLAQGAATISNPQSVLTPHEGELRRLIPEVFTTTACRVTLAQAAADKMGCVVLFKGPGTIIAAPSCVPLCVSAQPYMHTSWLATAGSGDVLAGFVTGLLARGIEAFEAAALAADLHFRCAQAFGPGLIAEDLPEMLPQVLR